MIRSYRMKKITTVGKPTTEQELENVPLDILDMAIQIQSMKKKRKA